MNTHVKSLSLFFIAMTITSSIGVIDSRPIFQGLSIQTNKFDPPRIAFDQIFKKDTALKTSEDLLNVGSITLSLQAKQEELSQVAQSIPSKDRQIASSIERIEPRISRISNQVREAMDSSSAEDNWMESLSPAQKNRLMYAQVQSRVLDQPWKESNSDSSQDISQQTQQEVASTDSRIKKKNNIITGPIRFDQVAYFPGIEVRAGFFEDGKAVGDIKVDMNRFVYEVPADNLVGTVKAKVFYKDGRLIGEGSVRLNPAQLRQGVAPRLVVKAPTHVASVTFEDFDNRSRREIMGVQSKKQRALTADTLFTAHREEKPVDFENKVEFNHVAGNSWGILRTQSDKFYPSLYLFNSTDTKTQPLFSRVMVESLRSIVEMQRMTSQYEINGSVVIAKVAQDGKALSGVQVLAEAFPYNRVIYFNEFFLPDSNQNVTASHGYVAFLDLPEGLVSLVAKAGEAYLTHANVLVDSETLSFVELESTLQKDIVPLVVSDAFNGLEQKAEIEGQSWATSLQINGSMNVLVPRVSRLSLLKMKPMDFRYADSVYVYNDNDEYLDLKLIEVARLQSWKSISQMRIDENSGTVVVFSESENYEVYFPHLEENQKIDVIFFDAAGNIVDKPVAFGGFVALGVPAGVHSVTLVDLETHLSKSQVVPVDPLSLVTTKISF